MIKNFQSGQETDVRKLLKAILNSIAGFFNRMADQEAERVINFYSQIFETKPNKGGGKLR